MRDDGGDHPAYCLMVAYRSQADAEAALEMLTAAPTTQPAPQQEAQEPVMIYHGDCTIDCGEHGHHHVELLRMIPAGSKLYTEPQPSPASQGDALDTALLDWLDENIFYRDMSEWDAKYGHGSGYNMWVLFAPKGAQGSARSIIDAARAAQEGK